MSGESLDDEGAMEESREFLYTTVSSNHRSIELAYRPIVPFSVSVEIAMVLVKTLREPQTPFVRLELGV